MVREADTEAEETARKEKLEVTLTIVVITEIFQVIRALQFIFLFLLILHTGRLPALAPDLFKTSTLFRCSLLNLELLQSLLLLAEPAEPDDEPVDQLNQGDEAEAQASPYQSTSLSQEANPGERHNSICWQ